MNPCILESHPDQLTPSEVMDTITEAIEEAKELFPVIKARLIMCCITPMPEISMDVARLAVKYKSKGLFRNLHTLLEALRDCLSDLSSIACKFLADRSTSD